MTSEKLDCRSCGACCQALPSYEGKAYVRLRDADIARMSNEQVDAYTIPISPTSPHRGMKILGLRCAALAGDIGSCVSCRIYENRPSICQVFENGSDLCMLAREEAGLGEFGVA